MKNILESNRVNLVNLKTMCIFVTKCILDFQVKKRFQMVKKRKSLTVIHSKDCFLYQGSELNKRKDEMAEIGKSNF